MLVNDLTSKVTEIDRDESAVVLDPPRAWEIDHPIIIGKIRVEIIYAENDKLWVGDLTNIEVGQEVRQDSYVGELADLFKSFGNAWRTRWDRHLHINDSKWDPVTSVAKQVLPVPPPMQYQPITYEEWTAAVRRKKKNQP